MKVFIAGGAGYIGGHVADELVQRGHEVTIYDLAVPNWLKTGQKFVQGKLNDAEKMADSLKGMDIVYNFASIADIGEASRDRINTLETNIIGCANLLEACVKNKVKKFVLASTVYVYSDKGSFYRISKQAAELLVEEYSAKFGLNYVVIRYGSLYGGRAQQWNGLRRHVEEILTQGKVTLKGKGEAKREYIHAEDAARMSVDILDDRYAGKSILLTGTQSIVAKDLIKMIEEVLGSAVDIAFTDASGDHYEMSPYRYQPKSAVKLTTNEFIDFGQGLIEVIHRTSEELKAQGRIK